MSPRIVVADDLAAAAGPPLLAAIAAVAKRRGRCRLALSGGSTPAPLFNWLREHVPPAQYRQLWVTWADERHPEASNWAQAQTEWLAGAPAQPARVLPMSTPGSLDAATTRFAAAFGDEFDGAIDIAVLGVGPDGHIASLFPGHPALDSTGGVVSVRDSPKPPPQRISLTFDVLAAVDLVLLIAKGTEKADVLARAWAGDESLPLARCRPRGESLWVLARDAAAKMTPQHRMKLRNKDCS